VTGQVYVSGGFGPVDDRYPGMSPSLRASIAAADAQDVAAAERADRQRREAWAQSNERCIDQEMFRIAREEGLPLAEACRQVGHEKHEFVALCSARADLQDAQEAARYRAALRRAGFDPNTGAMFDEVPAPSDRETETAARLMRDGEDPAAVGRAVRSRWLRRAHGGDLR
jgi:hypothetical protein